jgi:hypothetical protein
MQHTASCPREGGDDAVDLDDESVHDGAVLEREPTVERRHHAMPVDQR